MRTWVKGLIDRRGLNHANVALANKMARQAWVILAKQTDYHPLEVAGEATDG
jgi:transposase